ncbi:MAG: MFS transporter [Anaerolineae bacterium]|nr:MFS transporter [Anaerolineae bacterium]
MKNNQGHRWFVFATFFFFMLLHQSDKLLIGPLTSQIMATFHIDEVQMGAVTTGALIVGGICYPLWGYLYDRYARSKLLALASLLWGATTWLNAIAPTYKAFVITRASTGIDDSSYPGIFSLVSDYFEPKIRGKVYGLLEISQPLGYMMGMLLAMLLGGIVGWQGVFFITGSLGIVLSAVIFFGVKEPTRGQSEPELQNVEHIAAHNFNWKTALALLKKPSLRLLYLQGFFGVFPWTVITYWFFRYLETERNYSADAVFFTMVFAVIVLAAGYPLGGAIGDWLFKKTPRGRLIVATTGVIMGAILLWITLSIPNERQVLFAVMLGLTAIFIPMAGPNVASTVFDITLPEVRSTSMSIQNLIETIGSALAPLLAGIIAVNFSLGAAILILCTAAWAVCFLAFLGATYHIPKDIALLRAQLKARAEGDVELENNPA